MVVRILGEVGTLCIFLKVYTPVHVYLFLLKSVYIDINRPQNRLTSFLRHGVDKFSSTLSDFGAEIRGTKS